MSNFNKLTVLIFTIFFVIFGCKNKKSNVIQKNNISKIEISYVDLINYLTPYDISCDYFEDIFFDEIKEKIITKETELNEIESYLKETKKNNKIVKHINVRFKMIVLHKNKETDTICGNGNTIKIDSVNYLIPKEFSLLLYKITESK